MSIFSKFDDVRSAFESLTSIGRNPFGIRFDEILSPTEAVLDGRRILLFGTNNYLGLTFDPALHTADVLQGRPSHELTAAESLALAPSRTAGAAPAPSDNG